MIDPRGACTPVTQALQELGARRVKPATPPPTLLATGIVVATIVLAAGLESVLPALAGLALAGVVIVTQRMIERRARRTDRMTTWASRSGQAAGGWQPSAPAGRTRLVIDQRGLAVADLSVKRRPHAVLLWRQIARMTVVPGRENRTEPGVVAHLTDGTTAVFITSLNTHEVLAGLEAVGVLTDFDQVFTAQRPVSQIAPSMLAARTATDDFLLSGRR